MMKNIIDDLKREFGKIFFLSIACVFLCYILLSFAIENFVIVPRGILVFAFFLTVYTGFLISKTKYDFIIIFRILLFAIAVFIGYISLLLVNVTDAVFFLFVPVILMTNFLFTFRTAIFTSAFFLCFHFFAVDVSTFFNLSLDVKFYAKYPQNLVLQENIGFSVATYFSLMILFYTDKVSHYKNDIPENENISRIVPEAVNGSELLTENQYLTEDEKYNVLYNKIINCLELEKPFQNPEFNIRKLAEMVESNTTYVSKALNKIGDKKFNQLINLYRIKQVKNDLDQRAQDKFTLEHIYKSAGFSQQSTFNRIFKEQMGKTPSEYIDFLK